MQRLKEYIYFFKSKAYISKYARHLDYMIFGGDFNCVFEHTDRKSKIVHTDKSTNTILEILDKFYLNDTWKKLHNSKCGFTWCDSSNTPASRIDYIFVSQMI